MFYTKYMVYSRKYVGIPFVYRIYSSPKVAPDPEWFYIWDLPFSMLLKVEIFCIFDTGALVITWDINTEWNSSFIIQSIQELFFQRELYPCLKLSIISNQKTITMLLLTQVAFSCFVWVLVYDNNHFCVTKQPWVRFKSKMDPDLLLNFALNLLCSISLGDDRSNYRFLICIYFSVSSQGNFTPQSQGLFLFP